MRLPASEVEPPTESGASIEILGMGAAESNVIRRMGQTSYAAVRVGPGAGVHLQATARPGLNPARTMIVCLDGIIELSGGKERLESGMVALVDDVSAWRAGPDGSAVALVSWPSTGPAETITIRPEMRWYDKYGAHVGVVGTTGDRDQAHTGYQISLPPDDAGVLLHVHRDLINLLFVEGGPAESLGVAVVETEAGPTAVPLHGGDLVIVRPGIPHNLAARPGGPPLRFFVFNDRESHYEDEDHSDYHNLDRVPWHRIATRPRVPGETVLIAPEPVRH